MRYSLFYGENNLRFCSLKGRIHSTAVVQSWISALCHQNICKKNIHGYFRIRANSKSSHGHQSLMRNYYFTINLDVCVFPPVTVCIK